MSGRHRKAGPPEDTWAPEEPAQVSQAAVATETARHRAPAPAVPPSPVVPLPAADLTPSAVATVAPPPVAPAPFSAPVGTGSAAEAAPVLPVGSSARRAAREAERSRSRRSRLLVAGGVGVLVVAVLLGGYRVLTGRGTPAAGPSAAAQRLQTTLLLEVVDSQRRTVTAVLFAHDTRGGGTGFGALVPSTLAVDASGSASGTFGSTSTFGPPDTSAVTLSDVLGVTVDGTWVLDATGLAALIDGVGGIDVDVNRDVVVRVGSGQQTIVSAGQQHLSGAAAVSYATYLAGQEPEQSRLARFSDVLTALLPKLPAGSAARSHLLTALGTHSSSTDKPNVLAAFLGGLRSDAAGNRIGFDTLPTRSLDLGTGTPTLLIDPTAANALVTTNFAGSLPTQRAGGPISAVIQNGVGTPGLGAAARTRLVVAGITYVSGGNAGHFGYARSVVLVPTASGSAGQKKGAAVAAALGLPASDVTLTDQGQTIADVVVILGADFKP